MRGSAVFLLAATLGVTGCIPPPPQYKDPLVGIVPISASAVPPNATVTIQQPAALIVSDNTEAYLEYQKSSNQVIQAMNVAGANNGIIRDMDPKSLIDGVISRLRKRYPQIALVDDMNAAASTQKKTVFVVDVQAAMGQIGGEITSVDLQVLTFDADRKAGLKDCRPRSINGVR